MAYLTYERTNGAVSGVVLIVVWVGCMYAMGYFAGHRNQLDVRPNRIEQFTNAAGQPCLLLALLLV